MSEHILIVTYGERRQAIIEVRDLGARTECELLVVRAVVRRGARRGDIGLDKRAARLDTIGRCRYVCVRVPIGQYAYQTPLGTSLLTGMHRARRDPNTSLRMI